jgi:aryl-alcohol dehydrogenase-like predicted oxidoreductase
MMSTSTLPKCKLGRFGADVPRLGLGLMGLSAFYGKPKPDNERLALLDTAYELGETFWDTGKVVSFLWIFLSQMVLLV